MISRCHEMREGRVVGKPIFDRPMTAAERQARHRKRRATERNRETEEALHARRHSLGKVAFYLAGQPGPEILAHALAALDGPTLPYEVMAEAAGWLARFASTYRQDILLRQGSVVETGDAATDRRSAGP
jgi:hypothetical protein